MDEQTLSDIQSKIGYQFENPVLLKQAFISPSVTDATQNRVQNYQILEFIGDAVLGLSVVKNLAEEFCSVAKDGQFVSSLHEGHLSEEKIGMVKNERLAACSAALDLDAQLERAHGHLSHDHKNKQGDLIESILGAAAIDSHWNMEILSQIARNLLSHTEKSVSFVEKVRKCCQQKNLPPPRFSFWQTEARYDCIISVSMTDEVFVGNGKSAEEAQNAAAESAYRFIVSNGESAKKVAKPISSTATPVVVLYQKYLKKEICKPTYTFTQVKENKQLLWLCTLTLKESGECVSAKAASQRKAKQTAAQGMLTLLNKKAGTIARGQGLLRLAMDLRKKIERNSTAVRQLG